MLSMPSRSRLVGASTPSVDLSKLLRARAKEDPSAFPGAGPHAWPEPVGPARVPRPGVPLPREVTGGAPEAPSPRLCPGNAPGHPKDDLGYTGIAPGADTTGEGRMLDGPGGTSTKLCPGNAPGHPEDDLGYTGDAPGADTAGDVAPVETPGRLACAQGTGARSDPMTPLRDDVC